VPLFQRHAGRAVLTSAGRTMLERSSVLSA
jgi:DNA-binding transcriptional LysR family regulator